MRLSALLVDILVIDQLAGNQYSRDLNKKTLFKAIVDLQLV